MTKTLIKEDLKFSWIKCPACGRKNYYHRRKTYDYVCNLCPCIFRADIKYKITYSISPPKESM